MIKIFLNFFLLWVSITLAISTWRSLSNADKWSTVKTLTYGLVTAIITFVILATIVIVF